MLLCCGVCPVARRSEQHACWPMCLLCACQNITIDEVHLLLPKNTAAPSHVVMCTALIGGKKRREPLKAMGCTVMASTALVSPKYYQCDAGVVAVCKTLTSVPITTKRRPRGQTRVGLLMDPTQGTVSLPTLDMPAIAGILRVFQLVSRGDTAAAEHTLRTFCTTPGGSCEVEMSNVCPGWAFVGSRVPISNKKRVTLPGAFVPMGRCRIGCTTTARWPMSR